MREIVRAAFVIARRDFSAVILSKTFIFFLLGPLFPLVIGMAFGGLGERMKTESLKPTIALAMPAQDAARIELARRRIAERVGPGDLPALRSIPLGEDPRAVLAHKDTGFVAVLSGTVDRPVLTGKASDLDWLQGNVGLMASVAKIHDILPNVTVERRLVADNASGEGQARLRTGRVAQLIIFFLTMLLAGMVLANMVEEKTNKIIEILAAAVPIDAVFLGKLLAMLAMSYVGILFWGGSALALVLTVAGPDLAIPAPAVGWPLFLALGAVYFTMLYLLLGSLFLGIGAQAATVREVQTLNMPVTMGQMVVFFFATYAIDHMGSTPEIAACLFPFSSPFAMIARAAQDATLWTHLAAIVWQGLWVAFIIRLGGRMFRRHVMKSGPAPKARRFSRLFSRRTA